MNIFTARLSKTTIALFLAAGVLIFLHPPLATGVFIAGLLIECVAWFSAARDARRQQSDEPQK
jgi:uncharacterized oligopeptide transporter (OPT) family protein